MPLFTAAALVLRTYKLGEADRIVVFLTRDRGKKRGVAKGARRQRSRFVGALEPLTEVRVAYFEKEQRELVGLNYAETIRSPLELVARRPAAYGPTKAGHCDGPAKAGHYVREEGPPQGEHYVPEDGSPRGGHSVDQTAGLVDADALGYVSYFAELLDEWAQDADADDRLYRLGVAMLDALAAGAPADPLARYFEYWLLRLQGLYPEARGTLSNGALEFLMASRSVPPRRVGDLPAARGVLKELETVHRGLIAMHLEKTLKSDRVLRDLRRF